MVTRPIFYRLFVFIWIGICGLVFSPIVMSQNVETQDVKVAQSLSRADIQAAVNSAKIGDAVALPEGTNSSFTGTVFVPAGIEIMGQGPDRTILRRSSTTSSPLFEFEGTNGEEVRFSGVKLQGTYNQSGMERGLRLLGNCQNFRIWNSEFEDFSHAGIYIAGNSYGAIWDCTIKDCSAPGLGYGVYVDGSLYEENSPHLGDSSWARDLGLGGPDAVYIEDCSFSNNRHSVDAGYGGRYVVRYSNFIGNSSIVTGTIVNTHGETSSGNRGTRKFEIYENTIQHETQSYSIYPHGGDGVIFNNTISNIGNPTNWLLLGHPCCDNDTCGNYPESDQTTLLYIWGNTVNGSSRDYPRVSDRCSNEQETLFRKNRDWFEFPKQDYEPFPYPHPLRLANVPMINLSQSSLTFHGAIGGGSPASQTIRISNSGGGILSWNISENMNWLHCSPTSGSGSGDITVSVDSAGLSAGDYTGTITMTSPNAGNTPRHIQVSLNMSSVINTRLTISAATGSPALGSGGTTNPPPGVHSFSLGSSAQISALTNSGFRFSRWSGDVTYTQLSSETISVVMDANKSIEANFCIPCGDVTGDLEITPSDAQKAMDIYLGRITNPTFCELESADVNGDGTKAIPVVTPADAHAIFKYFLGIEPLPSDCSIRNRKDSNLATAAKDKIMPRVSLAANEIQFRQGQDVFVPVIVDDSRSIGAFGFDIRYPWESLEFVSVETTDLSDDFQHIDYLVTAEGVLRIGGYGGLPSTLESSGVFLILVFKATQDPLKPVSFSIDRTVDDIRIVSKRAFSIFQF